MRASAHLRDESQFDVTSTPFSTHFHRRSSFVFIFLRACQKSASTTSWLSNDRRTPFENTRSISFLSSSSDLLPRPNPPLSPLESYLSQIPTLNCNRISCLQKPGGACQNLLSSSIPMVARGALNRDALPASAFVHRLLRHGRAPFLMTSEK